MVFNNPYLNRLWILARQIFIEIYSSALDGIGAIHMAPYEIHYGKTKGPLNGTPDRKAATHSDSAPPVSDNPLEVNSIGKNSVAQEGAESTLQENFLAGNELLRELMKPGDNMYPWYPTTSEGFLKDSRAAPLDNLKGRPISKDEPPGENAYISPFAGTLTPATRVPKFKAIFELAMHVVNAVDITNLKTLGLAKGYGFDTLQNQATAKELGCSLITASNTELVTAIQLVKGGRLFIDKIIDRDNSLRDNGKQVTHKVLEENVINKKQTKTIVKYQFKERAFIALIYLVQLAGFAVAATGSFFVINSLGLTWEQALASALTIAACITFTCKIVVPENPGRAWAWGAFAGVLLIVVGFLFYCGLKSGVGTSSGFGIQSQRSWIPVQAIQFLSVIACDFVLMITMNVLLRHVRNNAYSKAVVQPEKVLADDLMEGEDARAGGLVMAKEIVEECIRRFESKCELLGRKAIIDSFK